MFDIRKVWFGRRRFGLVRGLVRDRFGLVRGLVRDRFGNRET